ncbi:MAG: helix-turn-helix domain-containing protein [Alcaligenaceae bacterium]|jgi:transcriptional regulator with XRE-family HTH domain|nr:helix-turn-helix domain-containing protein [Alcaligenaceae bacterium]HZJ96329.1 helix-turn-helix transcriptional regulator [Oligella sp.]
MAQAGSVKQKELGDFLRQARAKVTPAMAGLPDYGRRRTPGLRREEVAQLSGISVTWYTWIEQGRDLKVSADVWSALADALHLNKVERAYLFQLAQQNDPDRQKASAGSLPLALPNSVNQINTPAYILDRYWNILHFNQLLDELFGYWPDQQEPGQANLLRFIFLEPLSRKIIVNWEDRARRSVAEFRADIAPFMEEVEVREFIDEFIERSDEFAQLWGHRAVEAREGGARGFYHPQHGFVEFEQLTFRLATHLDYKLVILS